MGADSISMARFINFLNECLENDLLEADYIIGKGGQRGIYRPNRSEAVTKEYLENYSWENWRSFSFSNECNVFININ